MIAQLDIDGFRFDKATQATVDALGAFGEYIRACAARHGKDNFFMPGEITGGNTFGSIYLGRGRQPDMLPDTIEAAVKMTNTSDNKYFIRDRGQNALDAVCIYQYDDIRMMVLITAGGFPLYDIPFANKVLGHGWQPCVRLLMKFVAAANLLQCRLRCTH